MDEFVEAWWTLRCDRELLGQFVPGHIAMTGNQRRSPSDNAVCVAIDSWRCERDFDAHIYECLPTKK